ncbi:MAG: non-canonical purine NTP pyrophosphatase [Planctomycetia bacterium]|nr:non-canonical purine NTP pyrophosphatase [Planctomycetia bacterium]
MESILVIGTGNRKKGLELAALLADSGWTIRTLADFPDPIEPEETGETFAENAAIKASAQATHLGQWVLADDSGLCVDALHGGPGVHSARFAGEPCDNAANNALLLEKLGKLPMERRGAQFVCAMALADPSGAVRARASGAVHGRIRYALDGVHGFGYDPLFEIPEYHRTFGVLPAVVKSILSHRAAAARQILPELRRLRHERIR